MADITTFPNGKRQSMPPVAPAQTGQFEGSKRSEWAKADIIALATLLGSLVIFVFTVGIYYNKFSSLEEDFQKLEGNLNAGVINMRINNLSDSAKASFTEIKEIRKKIGD